MAGPRAIPMPMEFAPDSALGRMLAFLDLGGPAMWAIAILSVAATALILWKIWHLMALGVFGRAMRLRVEAAATTARSLPTAQAEAEVSRVARAELAQAGRGLRGLELAATIGPLLGLLGTVTGMIAAFQALQTAGANADPATCRGIPVSAPKREASMKNTSNKNTTSIIGVRSGRRRGRLCPNDSVMRHVPTGCAMPHPPDHGVAGR